MKQQDSTKKSKTDKKKDKQYDGNYLLAKFIRLQQKKKQGFDDSDHSSRMSEQEPSILASPNIFQPSQSSKSQEIKEQIFKLINDHQKFVVPFCKSLTVPMIDNIYSDFNKVLVEKLENDVNKFYVPFANKLFTSVNPVQDAQYQSQYPKQKDPVLNIFQRDFVTHKTNDISKFIVPYLDKKEQNVDQLVIEKQHHSLKSDLERYIIQYQSVVLDANNVNKFTVPNVQQQASDTKPQNNDQKVPQILHNEPEKIIIQRMRVTLNNNDKNKFVVPFFEQLDNSVTKQKLQYNKQLDSHTNKINFQHVLLINDDFIKFAVPGLNLLPDITAIEEPQQQLSSQVPSEPDCSVFLHEYVIKNDDLSKFSVPIIQTEEVVSQPSKKSQISNNQEALFAQDMIKYDRVNQINVDDKFTVPNVSSRLDQLLTPQQSFDKIKAIKQNNNNKFTPPQCDEQQKNPSNISQKPQQTNNQSLQQQEPLDFKLTEELFSRIFTLQEEILSRQKRQF